jgi:hypothetical protein
MRAATPANRESGTHPVNDATEPSGSHRAWCEYKEAENTVLRGKPEHETYDILSQMALPELVQRVVHGRCRKGDVAEAALISIAHEANEVAWTLGNEFDVSDVDPNLLEYIANRLGDIKDRAEAAVELHRRIRDPWERRQPEEVSR